MKTAFLLLASFIFHLEAFTVLHNPQKSQRIPFDRPNTAAFAKQQRLIQSVDKFSRLPVWPAWNGVFIWMISKILGDDTAAQLEANIGGRVGPQFYDYQKTDPFVLLVHHCHSFSNFDPLRYFQRTFFPEGFPAHPHRGFITLTIILKGGFVHRDSLGVRQRYDGAQWLFTGSGMLHEEMFDGSDFQELYQIWINVSSDRKMKSPFIELTNDPPVVEKSQSRTVVYAGQFGDVDVPAMAPVTVLHVSLDKEGAKWTFDCAFETILIYVRSGALTDGTEAIPVHHSAYLNPSGITELTATTTKTQFLVLAADPLREPMVASGSMVMTKQPEIDQAYQDYQAGMFGIPWDHKLTDKEWKDHVARTSLLRR